MCSQPSSIPSWLFLLWGSFTFFPDYLFNVHGYDFAFKSINPLFPHHWNTDYLHTQKLKLDGFQIDPYLPIIDVLGNLTLSIICMTKKENDLLFLINHFPIVDSIIFVYSIMKEWSLGTCKIIMSMFYDLPLEPSTVTDTENKFDANELINISQSRYRYIDQHSLYTQFKDLYWEVCK